MENEKAGISKSYQNLCTQYYELDKPFAPEDGLKYYLQHAEEATGPILEPMCGTGRFLIPMGEAGYTVTGFDNSPHMLSLCRSKCQNSIPLVEATFQSFTTDSKYSLVFIPSSSLCLLSDIAYPLKRVHHWLKEGGKFIFEIETVSARNNSEGIWRANCVRKPDGSLIVLNHTSHFDSLSSTETILCRYEHWIHNEIVSTEVEEIFLKLYQLQEVERILLSTGFQILNCTTPYTSKQATDDDEVVLFECKRL